LPGCLVVVGDTADEARDKRALLDSLVHPDSGIASLSIALGCDASQFDLDSPLPEIPESNASKSGRERVIERARRDNLTVRQLAQIAGSYGGLALVGTPKMIADQMEEWLYSDACDGFTSCSRGSRAASTTSSTASSPKRTRPVMAALRNGDGSGW
jgi:alkanesulfonate monooxygenase